MLALMANSKKVISFIVSNPLKKFKGTMSKISLLFSRKASSFVEIGTGMCRPTTTVAPFHSNSCSSRQRLLNCRRSIFDRITNRDDAVKLFDEMTAWQPLPSVARFTQLLQAVTKLRHYSCSVEFFQRMNSLGVPINTHTTSIVIQCLCQMKSTKEGFAVLGYGTKEGFAVLGYGYKRAVVPDVFILSTLLDGLILENKVPEAETFFRKLVKDKVCQPNVAIVMYTNMIKGLCKIGDTDAAIAFLRDLQREMFERDHTKEAIHKPKVAAYNAIAFKILREIKLENKTSVVAYKAIALNLYKEIMLENKTSVVAYGAIIDSLCKKQEVDEALKLFRELVFHERLNPDVATYIALLHGLGDFSRRDDISKLYIELEANNRLYGEIPKIFVCVYCRLGWMEDAEDIVKSMQSPAGFYETLICGYSFIGNVSKAREYIDLLRSKSISVDISTYKEFMKALYKGCLNVEEPFNLLDEMIEQGLEPTLGIYHIMLEGLFKKGLWARGRGLFNWMLEHSPHDHQPDDVTYMIVLRGLCDNKQVDEALSVYHSMGDQKLNSGIVMYNLLIEAASESGKLDAARNLFYDLIIKGVQPESCTYLAMINGYFRQGHVEQARHLFLEMKVTGVLPNCLTYGKMLLQELLKYKQLDMAEMLIQEMKVRGFDLSTDGCGEWLNVTPSKFSHSFYPKLPLLSFSWNLPNSRPNHLYPINS